MRPHSGEGCRREEGKGGTDGEFGKGKIKPSRERQSETLKISSVLINSCELFWEFCNFLNSVASFALSSVPSVLFGHFSA